VGSILAMPDVVMPRLSDSMEEGTILKWLKAEGDEVTRGDELVEIETDKATMTYEADSAGTLSIVAQEGDTLPIGEVIARIGAGGEAPAGNGAQAEATQQAEASGNGGPSEAPPAAAPAATAEPPAAAPEPEPAQPAAAAEPAAPSGGGDSVNGGRAKASPVARRIAREQGIDLSALQGTGPGGRIVKADVEAAASGGAPQAAAPAEAAPAEAAPAAPAAEPQAASAAAPPPPASIAETGTAKGDVSIRELTRTQQVIARRMAESKATVPEFTIATDVDMENAVEVRKQLKAAADAVSSSVVPSYNDMVVKAAALALREYPRANGSYKDGHFELYSRVNVGVAVAAQEALVVPTVFDADKKSLGEIARDARALAERVRANAVTPPELSGGTFTVSNLGMFGVTEFSAVINPPQAAILAVGKMEPRAVVRDGEIVAHNILTLTLVCDHRILYGAEAAEFLARIKALLEQPIALAL
jgi:pyruvate dehydrogenase E2 component (dihydrolipoamide acetyltransferase)